MNYKGNKLCHGCFRPATEKTRTSVDSLCYECIDLLRIGQKTKKLNESQSEYYLVHIYPFYVSDTQQSGLFFKSFANLCNTITDETKSTTQTKSIGNHSSSYSIRVIITPSQYESLVLLYKTVQDNFRTIEDKAKKEGGNLLISLNNGDITLDKFNEHLKNKEY